ncbi:tetratricopeptide repeat-containing sensor histidine kinase [Marivirga harenae]|uniref:tetratricopeptide repeat-containing sensor histidine kinase n=1 Tax=Marivirga harenae TaxID=2010992 RepID=UPI0026DEB6A0|nr:tetratricopeptide repeat-containing sensor histidine kinase [Marivirga harenae]WKV11166.1 tetratricopeptide repeat-containing sensor histidine kinase [Marivirga harenae]
MRFNFLILFTVFFNLSFELHPQQLSSSQDSIISTLNSLRFNYPDSALDHVNNEIQATKNTKSDYYAELLFLKSAIQYVQSNYLESRNTYRKLYNLSHEISNDIGIARALNGRGLIYLGRELYDEALGEFSKALKVNKKIGNERNITVNLLNIGICYQELGEIEKALDSYRKSYSIAEQNDLPIYALMNMNRLGTVFLDQQELDSAEYYLLKVYYESPNQWEKSYNLSGLAELELKRKNYHKAIEYGAESLRIAKEIGAKWDASEVALKLSQAQEKLGYTKKALEFHKLHKSYSDSLLNEEMNREINWAELQQAKAENNQLNIEKELLSAKSDRNMLTIYLMSALILFLVILAFLYRRHLKQKDKYNQNLSSINKQLADKKLLIEIQNQELKEINNTKNRLFSILSHDLRSPISSVKQLLEIGDKISTEDYTKYSKKLTKEVGKVDEQINALLKWANTQMDGFETNPQKIKLSDYISAYIEDISFIADEKEVEIIHHIADFYAWIDPFQLKIIVNNLLNNSLKYTSKGDQIKIDYLAHGNQIQIRIEDSGMGMDEETLAIIKSSSNNRTYSKEGTSKETGTGLGMLLVKQFLSFNHSSMDIESKEGTGTRFVLSFPKAKDN